MSTRIIPARAGFTAILLRGACLSPDHPRSRGVYTATTPIGFSSWGSSPLARGLPLVALVAFGAFRIIPARAGFTHSLCGRLFML